MSKPADDAAPAPIHLDHKTYQRLQQELLDTPLPNLSQGESICMQKWGATEAKKVTLHKQIDEAQKALRALKIRLHKETGVSEFLLDSAVRERALVTLAPKTSQPEPTEPKILPDAPAKTE